MMRCYCTVMKALTIILNISFFMDHGAAIHWILITSPSVASEANQRPVDLIEISSIEKIL